MNVYPPLRSARFSAASRSGKKNSPRVKTLHEKDEMAGQWTATTGVTNMCFKDDESDDVECISKNDNVFFPDSLNTNSKWRDRMTSRVSCDSGFGEMTPPMMSPDVMNDDVASGLYHRAMSRRKSLVDVENTSPGSEGVLSSGQASTIRDGRTLATERNDKSSNIRENQVFFFSARKQSLQNDVFTSTTSYHEDGVMDHELHHYKQRSASLVDPKMDPFCVPKPRSFSQPLLKNIPSVFAGQLEDICEEEVSIDDRGVSRVIKRPGVFENLTDRRATVPGKYDMKSPLLDDNSAHCNLDDWQVKLGDKEPAKCRCDGKTPAAPVPKPAPSESSESSIQYMTGNEVSIGDSEPMTSSDAPVEVEGIVTEIGSSRGMAATSTAGSSSQSATYSSSTGVSVEMPSVSAGRRKKTIKSIFRLGFLTTKSRRKSKEDLKSPSPDAGPPPASKRMIQRRVSRLEMNEPIEDIFSGVKFETIQKRPSTSNDKQAGDTSDDSDDEIIEDPEAIMRSLMKDNDDQLNGVEVFTAVADETSVPAVTHGDHDVIMEHHDVMEGGSLEKELLLPDVSNKKCSIAPLCGEASNKASEVDLR